MNIEIEVDGHKISISAPYVKTSEEAEHVVKMAQDALAVHRRKTATPLPFGFSVWADTERDTESDSA